MSNPDPNKISVQTSGLTIHSKGSPVKTFMVEALKLLGAAVLFIALVVALFMVTVNSLTGLFGFIFLFFGFMVLLFIILMILIVKREVKTHKNGGVIQPPEPEKSEGMSLGGQVALGVICVILFAVIYNAVAGS